MAAALRPLVDSSTLWNCIANVGPYVIYAQGSALLLNIYRFDWLRSRIPRQADVVLERK